jgi:hypothetical protein
MVVMSRHLNVSRRQLIEASAASIQVIEDWSYANMPVRWFGVWDPEQNVQRPERAHNPSNDASYCCQRGKVLLSAKLAPNVPLSRVVVASVWNQGHPEAAATLTGPYAKI